MKTATFIAALFALLSLTSAQVCTPVITCTTALSAVPIPAPWYNLTFSVDPRPANASYTWSTSGSNETGCASSAFHTGVVRFAGSPTDTTQPGPSINLTAPFGQPASVSTPLPTSVFFGVGTSQGSVQAGTAGWSIEVTYKAQTITNWAKVFDLNADGVGTPGGAGGHYSVFYGFSGTSNTQIWTTYGPNGGTGFASDITALTGSTLGQWYTILFVYQETAAGLANYYAYVNGNLVGTQQNVYFPPAVSRASANLARSGWADSYWVGEIDTFNIYRYALTASQAAALTARAQGGCAIAAMTAVNSTSTPPTPFFDASFTTDPRAAAGGNTTYGWVAQDADDATCGLNTHTGLLQLNGQYAPTPFNNYANLSASTGPQSVGAVLPTIGGASAGTGESAGWSFEITFKTQVAYTYSKIFDIAAPQNASRSNPCQYDILLGFLGSTAGRQPIMEFDVCSVGQEFSFRNWATVQLGTWYHIVIVVQQLPNQLTQAVYTAYMNGVRVGVSPVFYYPEGVPRANAQIAKSSWPDSYWGGLIDNFRVYNQALSGPQVSTLYNASMGAAGTQRCPQIASSALPANVSSGDVAYSLTFSSDPSVAAGVPGGALYSWVQSDVNDTAADRNIHQGLLVLGGSPSNTNVGSGPWVNLSSPAGPTSVGSVLPIIGTNLNGLWSAGSVGMSFELVIKMRQQTRWAKVMDLGAARGTPGGATGDIVLGWFENDVQLTFESILDNGATSGQLRLPNTTTLNQWLHIVISIQQTYNNIANTVGYVNGARVANFTMPFPFGQVRRDATLGRSNWPDDRYINAVYDLFRVYNIALNQAQVTNLYAASLVPAVAPSASSSSSSATTPVVSAGSSSSAVPRSSSSSSSSASSVSTASSGSSSSAVLRSSSSSSSSAAGGNGTIVVSSSAVAASSSSVATAAGASSSSTGFTAPVSVVSSSSSSVVVDSSSSSTGGTPPVIANGAASTLSSVAVAVCAVASLALML